MRTLSSFFRFLNLGKRRGKGPNCAMDPSGSVISHLCEV